jgi:sec-independent protein translocase protein TatA
MIGFSEIALILLVVLIIFGAGKLPNVMGDLGKGLKAFKEGVKDDSASKKDETLPPSA